MKFVNVKAANLIFFAAILLKVLSVCSFLHRPLNINFCLLEILEQ